MKTNIYLFNTILPSGNNDHGMIISIFEKNNSKIQTPLFPRQIIRTDKTYILLHEKTGIIISTFNVPARFLIWTQIYSK